MTTEVPTRVTAAVLSSSDRAIPRPRAPKESSMSNQRRIDGPNVSVTRVGDGQDSTVHVTGLPPLSQDDARWLLNELAKVTLMPTRSHR